MEDKDIKILEEFIKLSPVLRFHKDDSIEKIAQALKKLLQAYKQDEKVIEEMAKELSPLYGKQGAIDYFRKKCE